ncbi:MAG: winged helix-turn-helix transcriptional regulator [Solirubrobacterales bacterium]
MEPAATRSSHKPALHAGGYTLTLLAAPLNIEILHALEQGPKPLRELRRDVGIPPQSTMRLYLRTLGEIGAIKGGTRSEFPTSVDYEITRAGRALLRVGDTVQAWLQASPGGPKELGSTGAKSAIKALVEGWASNIVRALATQPLSLTELNSLILWISYPSLERRLSAMRQCDLVEAHQKKGQLTPYAVTDWLRQAIAPLTAATTWERIHAAEKTPRIGRLDVEAAFLLAVPLMDLPRDVSGKCRLAVEVHDSTSPVFAGVRVSIEEGQVISCLANLDWEAKAWVAGKPLAWLRQAEGEAPEDLELGGDRGLAQSVLDALCGIVSEP